MLRLDEPDAGRGVGRARRACSQRSAAALTERRFDAIELSGPGHRAHGRALPVERLARRRLHDARRAPAPAEPARPRRSSRRPTRCAPKGHVTSTKPLVLKDGTIVRGLRVRFEGGRAVEVDGRRERRRDPRAGRDRRGRGAARRARARRPPGPHRPARDDLLRHAARRERGQPHRARLRLPVRGRRGAISTASTSSEIHIDFMIGSPELDVTGVTPTASACRSCATATGRSSRRRLAGRRDATSYDCAPMATAPDQQVAPWSPRPRAAGRRSGGTRRRRALYTHALRARARACSPRAARSSSTPAATRAARRRTSSSCASRASEDRIWWGKVNQPLERGALRRRCATRSSAYLGARDLYVVDAFAGADPDAPDRAPRRHRPRLPRAVRADDVHHAVRRRSSTGFEPEAVVLHAPGLEADPADDGTRTRHVHRAAPVAARGADRRHVLRRRDQEVDLHGDERPAAARGRAPDALLGERRRRRRRRDLLRPLGHRQDDALGRPGAPADRRRRARLGRRGRLQLRGRLLREGDPTLGRGRAGDLRDDAHASGRSSRTSSSTTRGRLDLDDDVEDREHARRVQARADLERAAARSRPAIPRTSSSSPRTPSRCCRRSPGSPRRRRATGSSPASRRSSPARRSASPSRSRRSRRASAGRSCRSGRPSTRGCSARSSRAHGPSVWLVNTGWTGGPGRPPDADPGDARAAARRALRPARRASSTAPTTVFGFEVPVSVPGVDPSLLDPRSTWRDPAAYDAKAARARADVPRELREVRGRRARGRRRRPGRLSRAVFRER